MKYIKNGIVYTYSDLKRIHSNVSFNPTTVLQLGYEVHTDPVQELSPDQITNILSSSVEYVLNKKALEYRYNNIHTACMARDSHIPKFSSEGVAFFKWWGDVWSYVDKVEADVRSGARLVPSPNELISELPVFEPPVYI